MKSTSIIVLLMVFPIITKSQNLLKIGRDSTALSPMMNEYLQSYQQKNTIKAAPKKAIGISELKKSVENIDNLTIIKPDLGNMAKMPVVKPPNKNHEHLLIIPKKKSKRIPSKKNIELLKKEK